MLHISLGRPNRQRRDLDNLAKPVLDLLTSHQLIDDDSAIESLSMSWGPEPGATVRIWPFEGERRAISERTA